MRGGHYLLVRTCTHSATCKRMSRGRKYSRLCKHCGTPTTRHRATCSEECRVAVVHTDSREVRACKQCGVVFRAYRTSTQAYCSRACSFAAPRLPKPRLAGPPCVVCSAPTPHRRRHTCSVTCAKAAAAASVAAKAGRTPEKRIKRAAAARKAYRGKDKRMVEACLYDEQDGVCAVCGSLGTLRGDGTFGLVLDHCHRTGRPRALLCGRCNIAVGMVKENAAVALSLAAYVRRVCMR
jgi:hypothetical protein